MKWSNITNGFTRTTVRCRVRSVASIRRGPSTKATAKQPAFKSLSIATKGTMHLCKRISQKIEQVRKRGLPPLFRFNLQRGQAPLPDLFYSELFNYFLSCSLPWLAPISD